MQKFKEILTKELIGILPSESIKLLPNGYQRIGDIIILKLDSQLSPYFKNIANAVVKNFRNVKTVCQMKYISGELRKPVIEVLFGNETETIHEENGCFYKLDVSKVMFSKGNITERGRIVKSVRKNEIVVDMFAGIGYFSIPIAKTRKPKRIYSIDMNPVSVHYLKENMRLNKVESIITPILEDCRNVKMGKIADRVIMGYLPDTWHYLDTALSFLKSEGGIIHYHGVYSKENLWDGPLDHLERYAFRHGFHLHKLVNKKIVKSYAPKKYHIVLDAKFKAY